MRQTVVRGRRITDEEALQAMERFDKELRATFPKSKWGTYAVEHNGQRYPPKTICRLITGGIAPGGGKPVNSKFEDLGFKIVTLDKPPQPPGNIDEPDEDETALSLESDLEESLRTKLDQLEKGLKLYYKENGRSGQQFDAGSAGRIDLLAVDANGDLVVIELKAGEADRQVCGQIQAYMGWVKVNLAANRKVGGIIVASEFTDKIEHAVKVVPGLALKKYQMVFKFSDPQ